MFWRKIIVHKKLLIKCWWNWLQRTIQNLGRQSWVRREVCTWSSQGCERNSKKYNGKTDSSCKIKGIKFMSAWQICSIKFDVLFTDFSLFLLALCHIDVLKNEERKRTSLNSNKINLAIMRDRNFNLLYFFNIIMVIFKLNVKNLVS